MNKVQCKCKNCEKSVFRKNSSVKNDKNIFCSKSCSATYNNTHKTKGTRVSKLQMYLHKNLYQTYPCLEFNFNKITQINAQLDIYIPKLKLAFQINGIFHYQPIYGKDKLEITKNNDNRKFQACMQNGISLCIVDSSQQKYFKEQSAKKYLKIITEIIDSKYTRQDSQIEIIRCLNDEYKTGYDISCKNCEVIFNTQKNDKKKFCSEKCNCQYKKINGQHNTKYKNIPSKQILYQKLKTKSYSCVGKQFGVFGMTIRQWAIKLCIDLQEVKSFRIKNSKYHNQYLTKTKNPLN